MSSVSFVAFNGYLKLLRVGEFSYLTFIWVEVLDIPACDKERGSKIMNDSDRGKLLHLMLHATSILELIKTPVLCEAIIDYR